MAAGVRQAFRSLERRNARLFFGGLLVSSIGTWLQVTATALLVKDLAPEGREGTYLGLAVACQFVPMLVLGAWAGAVVDQRNRWRMTVTTQTALAVQALVLGVITLAGGATIPVVLLLGTALGVVNALDNPARRGLVTELVEPADLSNAMSLNTATMTGSRVFGPALAAVLVAAVGTGWCFVINGLSFAAVLGSLFLMDRGQLVVAPPAARGGTPVREGVAFAWGHPVLRRLFVVLVVVSTFSFNYQVSMPLLVEDRWQAADSWFGWLLAVVSIGSFAGSLMVAARREVGEWLYLLATAVLGVFSLLLAVAPNLGTAMLLSVPMGMGGAGFIACANAISQAHTPPEMRGRILALTAVAFLGSTPIGGPITGWIGDTLGAEWSMAYGGIVALATAGWAATALARARHAVPESAVQAIT
jgi:MFS family permease